MAVKIDRDKCTGCGACVDVCPADIIKIEKGKAVIGDGCMDCGACMSQCPVGAISFS